MAPSSSKQRPSALSTRRPTAPRLPTLREHMDQPGVVVTTILVANLHCSSCVRTIQDALTQLEPSPLSVAVSVVSQSVTVNHTAALDVQDIKTAIDDAGFDLVPTPVGEGPSTFFTPTPRTRRPSFLSRKHEKHAAQCELCKQGDDHAHLPSMAPAVLGLPPTASLHAPQETQGFADEKSSLTHQASEKFSPVPDAAPPDGPHHLTLSIGGMTCASCSNTITRMVGQVPGVTEVIVNLLGNSATVKVDRRDLTAAVVEAIDDCGFDAEVMAIEPLIGGLKEDSHHPGPRSVSLRIDGMFCQHCPEGIMSVLQPFVVSGQLTVDNPIMNYLDPILQVTYTPSSPAFTIRSIITAIAHAKPPSAGTHYSATLYTPPTLEDRTRAMQQHEKHLLLRRLLFSVIVAIPTFIIGIVYMSLVPASDPTRQFFMRPMWTGNTSRAEWALFFLATPVMFYSAGMFHRRSLKEIRALWRPGSRTPVWKRFVRFGSMNMLVSTGVSVAYFSSIVLLGLAAAQKASPEGMGDTTTYFDSVVLLTMFLLCGRFMEAYSKGRTADAITALGKLRPAEALLLTSEDVTPMAEKASFSSSEQDVEKGDPKADALETKPGTKIQKVEVGLLEVGDVVRVPNGSTPPADGILLLASGDSAAFDESSLTGESRLIKKAVGDEVFLGTINRGNPLDIRVSVVGGETMLDRIVKVVREGQTRRAPIERVADLVTAYFVPTITLLAVLTWIIWLSLGLSGALPQGYLDIEVGGWIIWSLEFSIAVFVVACPCGIGLAAPTALLVGSGLAAKYGILARGGGEAFQEAAQLDILVFDKTGTLTEGGDPKVTDVEVLERAGTWTREVILGAAAEIESASAHPLAIAVVGYCAAQETLRVQGSGFEETPGRGLRATFDDIRCTGIIGNEAWIEENEGNIAGHVGERLERWKSEGKSVVLLALRDDSVAGAFEVVAAFAVSDPIREEAKGVIAQLQRQGLGTWMISGDNVVTAKAVARLVGIPETNVIAGVLPHQKAEKIQWLQQVGMKREPSRLSKVFGKRRLNERAIVGMVGDGINDAPALSAADVGIAIGSGSDVAISSAAFILVSSNLQSILVLCELSHKVFTRVKFNFFWAGIYNIVALPIAAGVVYPAGHARLAPVWASLAMALSSVSVVCSSLLLKLYRPSHK